MYSRWIREGIPIDIAAAKKRLRALCSFYKPQCATPYNNLSLRDLREHPKALIHSISLVTRNICSVAMSRAICQNMRPWMPPESPGADAPGATAYDV